MVALAAAVLCVRLHPVPNPNPNRADQNMAGLSRAKAASIQILRTSELKAAECKRPAITQFHVRTAPSQVAAPRLCPELRACPLRLGPLRLAPQGPSHWDLSSPSGHFGTQRDPQGPAGIGLPVLPSDTLQTHKILTLTPPLNIPLQTQKIKFPLPHRTIKTPKAYKTTFKASSAKTFFG